MTNDTRYFSDAEQKLILDLTAGRIRLVDFLSVFRPGPIREPRFVLHALEAIETSGDSDSLPFALYLRGYLGEVCDEPYCEVLRRLLGQQWHNQYEWIIDTLQQAKDVAALPELAAAAVRDYPQLDELDASSLQRRCVYAIEAIDSRRAVPCLQELAQVNSEAGQLAADLLRTLSAGSGQS